MTKIICTIVFLVTFLSHAQSNDLLISNNENNNEESILNDTTADMLGLKTINGQDFRKYFVSKYNYPNEALMNEISGLLKVTFIVEEDGSVKNVKIIESVCETCDLEAVRIIKSTKFKPCEVDEKPVRCKYIFPIVLSLQQ